MASSYDSFVSTFFLWVIFVVQVIEFGHSNASTNVSCIGVEKEALLRFKHGLTDPSGRLSSWIGEECCKWEGVKCDKKTGHVLKLDLHNPCTEEDDFSLYIDSFNPLDKCRLGGNIVPSLIELRYLKYLDLSLNDFAFQKIPMFFTSLQKLEYLNLSGAGFSGDIPTQLSNLSKLQYLDLNNNFRDPSLTSKNLVWVPKLSSLKYLDLNNNFADSILTTNDLVWVSKLSSLKYLDMSGVNLSEAIDWFDSINMLPSLQSLALRYCELRDISSSSQANLTSLRFLDLYNSFINSSILPRIYNLSKLEHIDLYAMFANEGAFPTAIIKNFQRLTFLDMSWNNLQGEFPKNLSSLGRLQVVRFRSNSFHGNISTILDGPLSRRQGNWKFIDFSYNLFSGALPNQFRYLKEAEQIYLSHNSISGSIPANLVEMPYLRALDLSGNKLSGIIPESIGRLSNLKALRLSHNLLYGVFNELHFENLKSLTELDISSNQLILNVSSTWVPAFQAHVIDLSDCKVGLEFPKWLQTQKNITNLKMSNASISDNIPDWLWDFSSNIQVLDISGNMLKGQVPHDIGDKMSRLITLTLGGNNLTGAIPRSLCKLNNLVDIDLSKNRLSGRLPLCWGTSQRLGSLLFAYNKLDGQIPKSLCHLQHLYVLSLHKNGFSGEIPICLSNLSMSILDLSDNAFAGSLPPFGKLSLSLQLINLEKNHLVGGIPPQLCQLSHLQFLNLAQNNITGSLPKCFDRFLSMIDNRRYPNGWVVFDDLSVMVTTKGISQIYVNYFYLPITIDLSANMLDGQIPEELTRLVSLQNLNLSQNNLRGRIPSNIGDMKNLESLDLSRNKLSGTIPPSISNIDFLSRLNLSFNRLSGPIPSGNHLRTLDDESVYRGNDGLCGAPLLNSCPGDEVGDNPSREKPNEDDLDIRNWFYVGLAPGYTVGFLASCSILHFKQSWRISYFQAMDRAIEKFSMTTMIAIVWFKRTFVQDK